MSAFIVRRLAQEQCQILTVGRDAIDLRDQAAVDRWFDKYRPEAVLLAAARVGGIHENATHPGDFIYDNQGERHAEWPHKYAPTPTGRVICRSLSPRENEYECCPIAI